MAWRGDEGREGAEGAAGVDRSARPEVRWFVPGDAPRRLRPSGRPARRHDAYELDSLRSHHAVKRRGASPFLERKERIGRVELVHPHGVAGFAERWSKERFRDRRHARLA